MPSTGTNYILPRGNTESNIVSISPQSKILLIHNIWLVHNQAGRFWPSTIHVKSLSAHWDCDHGSVETATAAQHTVAADSGHSSPLGVAGVIKFCGAQTTGVVRQDLGQVHNAATVPEWYTLLNLNDWCSGNEHAEELQTGVIWTGASIIWMPLDEAEHECLYASGFSGLVAFTSHVANHGCQ